MVMITTLYMNYVNAIGPLLDAIFFDYYLCQCTLENIELFCP